MIKIMKRIYKSSGAIFFLLLIASLGYSQSTSINSTGNAPDPSAGLEINFLNLGFLIPRVALTGTLNSLPLPSHVAGMIVHNTSSTADVTPGLYFNDGAKWLRYKPVGTTPGNMVYWDGNGWKNIPPGLPGQRLRLNGSNIPEWQ